ncbi:ABC transporter substrate-binding protein [Xenorhabdus bovienii]|uniref:ABC transporter substrate-binding protein n=1 Tax=Xenorhabdus bovienii TaxID=40576 RepID=UPI0023B270BE|nr:ABC transporter substrate-binding protein [Xenorhabdus bovienii]MDE9432484.1 oligopeptide ABC transporter substrate-binding protein OppA [Xenorhabdus bovienii]MDE9490007.1 oligopeptide ABC transporter substrate-binding protein OppA [Xenorhabdus bovienii]MDE9506284.1 oligopeptide ABC transporter substrate-binding protein OppA [Xenorhabdus bovienii]MDE9547144.1 oligopeptide ABC transporter substrate-binding protein OppA [Xenorhabdus bovienii]
MKKNKIELITKKIIKSLSCSIVIIMGNMTLSHAAVVPPGTQLADKQEIVRNNGSEPASLDVHKVESDTEFNIIHDFFDGLVYTDNKGDIIPKLATSWETKDNQTWIFHLRKGAKWSDGSPITAHDVVFSWQRLLNPQMGSPYGSYLVNATVANANDILTGKKQAEDLGIKALDDFTLEVKLDRPVGDFLQMLAHPVMVIVSEKAIKKYGDKWTKPEYFVGSGPFKLSEWVVNEKVIGVRNPHYWDDKNTVINKVTYLPLSSDKADLNRYLAGEIDITNTIPLDSFESLKKTMNDQIYISPQTGVYFYEINNKKPPFDNMKVRQALNLAVDREVIVKKILGQGQKPAYTIVPPNVGGFKFTEPDYASWTQAQRIEKAKTLLNEAGFNQNNPLRFNLLYNTSEAHKKIAIAVSSMWKKNLGVDAVLQNQEWKVMLDNMHQGKFDVIRRAWIADYNSPMTFLSMFMSGQIKNTSLYENNNYDALIKKAGETNDKLYYQQGLDVITTDSPVIPIYYYINAKMVKPYIGGFYVNPMGYISTKNIYIIQH